MDRKTSLNVHRFGRRTLLTGASALIAIGFGRRATAANETPAPATVAAGTLEASPVGTPVASPVAAGPVFESPIRGLKYDPLKIDIEAGTTVTWINEDVVAHTVTHKAKPADQLFASPFLEPDDRFSYTFEKPGTYAVFCLPHPFMKQTVVVYEKP